jgi:hypothetical protein
MQKSQEMPDLLGFYIARTELCYGVQPGNWKDTIRVCQ